MEKQLLHTPEGVRDIYNSECEKKILIEDRIHSVFKGYGYNDIETPSFEFFDVFNRERGSVASNNMFKFFDRNNNTMVLRPDFTPAIARCAAKYFENDNNPIRLCYIGNTFINNSSYQGRLKETTQAGCELINESGAMADAEMIALMIESILSTGLEDFQVEVGHAGFFNGLTKAAGLSTDATKELKAIIRNKNLFSIEELLKRENIDEKYIDVFYKLPQMFGNVDILSKAVSMTDEETCLAAVSHLKQVYDLLKIYGFEKYVTFDLGVLSGLDYYTGVIFKAYTYDVGEPVGNGGRYDRLIGQFGNDKSSIGFCITIDLLLLAIMRQKVNLTIKKERKLIVYDNESLYDAIRLARFFRNSGIPVVISENEFNTEAFDEVVFADKSTLERYGIK